MAKNIFDITWLELTPESIRGDQEVQNIADAVTPEQQAISKAIRECIILARLDELPEQVVDLLAWQYHVDFYEMDFPLDTKRALVRQSIEWHRYKGTPWVVEQVVTAVYGNCRLSEWYEYGGKPYYFRVEVTLDQESTDKNRWKKVIQTINSVKNTRSWLEKMLFYYPDIILPIIIRHRVKIQQTVNTHHNFWNLGNIERARWDGEFAADGTIRGYGIRPDSKYKERQTHIVETQMFTDAKQRYRWYNIADGSVVADGSHMANGSRLADLVEHAVTFSIVKNNKEGMATPI